MALRARVRLRRALEESPSGARASRDPGPSSVAPKWRRCSSRPPSAPAGRAGDRARSSDAGRGGVEARSLRDRFGRPPPEAAIDALAITDRGARAPRPRPLARAGVRPAVGRHRRSGDSKRSRRSICGSFRRPGSRASRLRGGGDDPRRSPAALPRGAAEPRSRTCRRPWRRASRRRPMINAGFLAVSALRLAERYDPALRLLDVALEDARREGQAAHAGR